MLRAVSDRYELVQLKNGTHSVRSLADAETFHPVIGPEAEAQALYVQQLRLLERIQATKDEFVVWDVGLGAAANPLTFVRAAAQLPKRLRIISFDQTKEPLRFALEHREALGYFGEYGNAVEQLERDERTRFSCAEGGLDVDWEFRLGDFPTFLDKSAARQLPKPHAIFFDAFSPQKNPAMWTLELFTKLYQLLSPERHCAMPTYSRSTLLRVTLLLSGFFVGVGHATGEKEETTIAANHLSLIEKPLDGIWLTRAQRSGSAEPLHSAEYRQGELRPETLDRLISHPQFR